MNRRGVLMTIFVLVTTTVLYFGINRINFWFQELNSMNLSVYPGDTARFRIDYNDKGCPIGTVTADHGYHRTVPVLIVDMVTSGKIGRFYVLNSWLVFRDGAEFTGATHISNKVLPPRRPYSDEIISKCELKEDTEVFVVTDGDVIFPLW